MVKHVRDHKNFLKLLAKANRRKRHYMLAVANPAEIETLRQISYNTSKNVIPLKKPVIKKLVKGGYRKHILAAGKKKQKLETKRKILVQHGGFLQYVIPAALMYLANQL